MIVKSFKDLSSSDRMFLGILALIAIGMSFIYMGKGATTSAQVLTKTAQTTPASSSATKIGALEKELESKLEANLLQMEGAGKVQVSVTLSTGLRSEYAQNENTTSRTTKSTDNSGGVQETKEVTENNQLVMPAGATIPVMVMEDRPEVAGVLIIAQGASDPKVREEIHNAVQTLLSIPTANIKVVPMGGS